MDIFCFETCNIDQRKQNNAGLKRGESGVVGSCSLYCTVPSLQDIIAELDPADPY